MSSDVKCPLCGDKRFVVLRRFRFDALVRIWKKNVGFNPFPKLEDGAELQKRMCIECGLSYYYPQIIGDSAFYSKLSKFEWYYPRDHWEFDKVVALIKEFKPRSVLEVGCGAGECLSKIVGCVDNVMGLDINESAVKKARSKGLDVSNQSIVSLDKSFDMIFMFQVLEHLESPKEFISALIEKLNPGGCLILAVPNPDGFMKFIDIVFLDMPPHHNTCWSKDALTYLAGSHQLQLVHYEREPMNYEYFRSLLFAQIAQSGYTSPHKIIWAAVKFAQKVMALLMLPALYLSGNLSGVDGQTHLVVLQKSGREV